MAQFGAVCACVYFGISVSTMVRDLHLSSIVIVVPMAVAKVGASLVQFVVWDGDFVSLVLLLGCVPCWCAVSVQCVVSSVSVSLPGIPHCILNETLFNPWDFHTHLQW